jgi:hypothetical protein
MSRVIHGLCVDGTMLLLASCGAPATTGSAWEQIDGDSAVIAPEGSDRPWPGASDCPTRPIAEFPNVLTNCSETFTY